MEGQQAAPVVEPVADQADTPAAEPLEAAAQEPVEPTAPGPVADKSTAASQDRTKVQQAEFTRATQAIASIRTELELPATATRDEVMAAVRALREQSQAPADVDEPEPLTERELAAEERAWQSEFRWQAALHGEEATTRVVEFIRLARESNDIGVIMAAFQDATASISGGGGEESPGEGDEAPADDQVVPAIGDIGLSEGDRGPSARPTTTPAPGGRRAGESGVVDHIRDIFDTVGNIANRGRPPVPR